MKNKITKKDLLNLITENYGFDVDETKIYEHHLSSREDKIDYILNNHYLTNVYLESIDELENMSDEEVDDLYNKIEDELKYGSTSHDLEKEPELVGQEDFPIEDNEDNDTEFYSKKEIRKEEILPEGKVINKDNLVDYIMDYESGDFSMNEGLNSNKEYAKEQQANDVATEDIDGWSDEEVAEYLDISVDEVNFEYRKDAIDKRTEYYLDIWEKEGLLEEGKKKKPSAGLTKILTKQEIMEQFNKKQNIKETTEVSRKHPSVINQERINKETAKETKQDRDKTFIKNMDKIIKGGDDFQYVNEPKYDKDSLKKEDIEKKNAGMVGEKELEEYKIGGMDELRYDRKPEGFDERMEEDIDPVKGKRVYANSVATESGKKRVELSKKKIENKDKAPTYKKDAQPIENKKKEDKGKEKSVQESKNNKKQVVVKEPKGTPIKDLLSEETIKELNHIKHLFSYKPSNYVNNPKPKK